MRFPNIVPPEVNFFFAVDDVAADVDVVVVVVVVASVVLSSIGSSDFCA